MGGAKDFIYVSYAANYNHNGLKEDTNNNDTISNHYDYNNNLITLPTVIRIITTEINVLKYARNAVTVIRCTLHFL